MKKFSFIRTTALLLSFIFILSVAVFSQDPNTGSNTVSSTDVLFTADRAFSRKEVPITGNEPDLSVHHWLNYGENNLYKDYTIHRSDEFSYCISENKANDLRIIKKYIVEPNTLYAISADVKTKDIVNHENSDNPLGATISTEDYNVSHSILGTNDWQTIRLVGRSDARGILNVSMNLGYYSNTCTGTAWFENIRLTPVSEFAASDNTWRFLAVILTETGIDTMDPDTNRHIQLSHKMSSEEISAIRKSLSRFEEDFSEDAAGLFKVDVDIVEATEECTDYSRIGESDYTINTSSARAYLEQNNIDIAGYDHVIMITCLPSLPAKYYGLGGTFIQDKIGFSFVLHTDVKHCIEYLNGNFPGLWPAAVYVHEFLHSVESYSHSLNFEIPDLHNGEKYGYIDTEEWREWYWDYIHKNIISDGKKIGVDPMVWKLRPSLFSGADSPAIQGKVTTFGSEEDEILIELIDEDTGKIVREATVTENSAVYSFMDVAPHEYILRVNKKNHVIREYRVIVR